MLANEEVKSVSREIYLAIRHSFVYGLGNVLAKAMGFLLLPFYTHHLSPRDYGIWEILEVSMSLLTVFLNMGVNRAVLQYYGTADTQVTKRRVVSTAFLFLTAIAASTLVVGNLTADTVTAVIFGGPGMSAYFMLSLTSFTLSLLGMVPIAFLRAKEASGKLVALQTLGLLLQLSLNIYFIAGRKMGLVGVLLSPIISGGITTTVFILWTLRKVGVKMDLAILRKMLVFGAPLIISSLAMFFIRSSDRFFLQHYRSLEDVGIYSIGYRFGSMIDFLLIQPFGMMWQARLYAIYRQSEHRKTFSQVFVFYSFILISAGLAVALFSPEIVGVMVESRFAASQEVIPLIALGYVFWGLGEFGRLGMLLRFRTDLIAKISVVIGFGFLALNYALISRYGALGAAWASVIGFLMLGAANHYFSRRVFGLDLGVRRVMGAVAIAVAVYLFSHHLYLHTLSVALLAKGLLLACFPILLFATGFLSVEEIATVAFIKESALASAKRVCGFLAGREANP